MILYQIEVAGLVPDVALARFFDAFDRGDDLDPPPSFMPPPDESPVPLTPAAREYASVLVRGVYREREALDGAIQAVSPSWRVERMAKVDRNILRLGAFEMLHQSEVVPRSVAINEALEIAKSFSAAESKAFINGILDRVDGGATKS